MTRTHCRALNKEKKNTDTSAQLALGLRTIALQPLLLILLFLNALQSAIAARSPDTAIPSEDEMKR